MIQKILNKYGYYKLEQLRVGGMCGCCGKSISRWIWIDEGNNWDDVGLCDDCRSSDDKVDVDRLVRAINVFK